jgi:hypothetical protein
MLSYIIHSKEKLFVLTVLYGDLWEFERETSTGYCIFSDGRER